MKTLRLLCATMALTAWIPLGYAEEATADPPSHPPGSLADQLAQFPDEHQTTYEWLEDGTLLLDMVVEGQQVHVVVTDYFVSEDGQVLTIDADVMIGTNGPETYAIAASGSDIENGYLPVTYERIEPAEAGVIPVDMATGQPAGQRGIAATILVGVLIAIASVCLVAALITAVKGFTSLGKKRQAQLDGEMMKDAQQGGGS